MDIQLNSFQYTFTLFPTSIKQLLLQLTRYSQPSKVLIIFQEHNGIMEYNIGNFFFLGLNEDSLKRTLL